ncbi:kinesin-like protein [Acrasis kona]|uniref:Kinesin-like protein n=1 Tax=Acrasis kona TaxID=1008807 RepID=A0AAW2Z7W9_9EUKA
MSTLRTFSKIIESGSNARSSATNNNNILPQIEQLENIKVAVRVRPLFDNEQDCEESLSVLDDATVIVKKGLTRSEMFFDRVFTKECSQEEVYQTVREIIDAVLKGYNGTVFAYGQTGTGKTHTMLGIDFNFNEEKSTMEYVLRQESKGIIPRSVEQILSYIKKTKNTIRYKIYCSYLEIYNERIYDLLSYSEKNVHLDIREDKRRGLYVQDLTTVQVTKEEDIYKLMEQGAHNRSVAATDMNERSSRSHTIFQMFIEQEPLNRDSKGSDDCLAKVSKLNLVDLAGSEKWNTFSNPKMECKRIQELTSINQSLSTLGNCISALMQPGRSHIPFRDSKLTRLLQDSLGGNTKTLFVATVSSSLLALEETLSTLKFADRAKRVVVAAKINEVVDDAVLIKRYEAEISRLRKELKSNQRTNMQIKALTEDNNQLRQEVEHLKQAISQGKHNGNSCNCNKSNTASESINVRIHKKLDILEDIESEQRDREKELDGYHMWLHSIPVQYDGEQHSLDIKDRLKLMENSVELQHKELARTKKLFIRDLAIVKDELSDKNTDLIKAYKKIDLLESQCGQSRKNINPAPIPVVEVSDNQNKILLESGISAFRTDLISMMGEHLLESESMTNPSQLVEDLKEIVDGCSEALEETISKCFKNQPRVPAIPINDDCEESAILRNYWQDTISKQLADSQEQHREMYILSGVMRNSISRAVNLIKKHSTNEQSSHHDRQQLQLSLEEIVKNLDRTITKPSLANNEKENMPPPTTPIYSKSLSTTNMPLKTINIQQR